MRIIYNQDYLFKGFPDEKIPIYLDRIIEFSKAIDKSGGFITKSIIDQFKLKKMKGTETIFKFYLGNDGTRCLLKYEDSDPQVFQSEPGIVLLRATYHEDQGKYGKALDKKYINYEKYILLEDEEIEGNDLDFDEYLGRNYMRTIYIPQNISNHELIKKMEELDGRVVYKLSIKQKESLQTIGPICLLGCAGSGKTLVEVSKALKNSHANIKQAYFTFTPMLRDVAKEIYDKYASMNGIIGQTNFYCIKDQMLKVLDLRETQYFSFERYMMWYRSNRFESKYKWLKEIGAVDLWTEIRGIIKGFVGNDCVRILELPKVEEVISKQTFEHLTNEGIIKKKAHHHHTYVVLKSEEFYEFVKAKMDLKLNKFIMQQDLESTILDEYSYIENMNIKYSQYSIEVKKQIYNFVKEHYQPHLEDKHERKYDDNDLARMYAKGIVDGLIDKIDYVFIDELQDLTEMQVYALIKLAVDPKNVFMSGDVSQIINPNFFRLGRIGAIFRNLFNTNLNKNLILDENYRNSESIVDITKHLLDIRQEKLGTYSEDIKEESKELEKRVGLPFFIDIAKEEFLPVLSTWIDVPRVAIIVATEDTKKIISKKFNIKRKTNIYTVQEVKGQEFEKIITFNIISEHKEHWQEIMSGEVDKGSEFVTKYKYFFNLLYVAITRGKNNLFMFEEESNLSIVQEIIHLFEPLKDRIEKVMDLKEYDSEENRKKQAEQLFKEQDYERARTYYLQLDDKRSAAICTGLTHLQKGNYHEGVMILYQFKEYHKKAFEYTNDSSLLFMKIILGFKTKLLDIERISTILGDREMNRMLSKLNPKKTIYYHLYDDLIDVMTTIHNHRFSKKYNIIKEKMHA